VTPLVLVKFAKKRSVSYSYKNYFRLLSTKAPKPSSKSVAGLPADLSTVALCEGGSFAIFINLSFSPFQGNK